MNKLTALQRKLTSRRGFSLAEALIVVAILLIIAALVIPNIAKNRKELRQKELDAKAEILYVAAQNQMSKLRASGNSEKYIVPADRTDIDNSILTPSDASGVDIHDTSNVIVYRFIDRNIQNAAGLEVMVKGVADDLLLDGNWIIEYAPDTGLVHSVFYWEKGFDMNGAAFDYVKWMGTQEPNLRDRNVRFDETNARLGYYSGTVRTTDSRFQLRTVLNINNEEELTATLFCTTADWKDSVIFTLELWNDGNEASPYSFVIPASEIESLGTARSAVVVLDSLRPDPDIINTSTNKSARRFAAQFPYDETGLVPGLPLHVRFTASGGEGFTNLESSNKEATTNSLFADDSTGTVARIAYGRHLQNLDQSSGVAESITGAVQTREINFTKDANEGDWLNIYFNPAFYFYDGQENAMGGARQPRFKPITNEHLTSYNGQENPIVGLNAGAAEGNSGLFATLPAGATLTDVYLRAPTAKGGAGTAGALVGTVAADCTIDGCRVYLEKDEYDNTDDKTMWISGANAGGLVGAVTGGVCKIQNSFAATVVKATGVAAGGLVGSGSVNTITDSYADCYLYGANTGGLVGSGNAGTVTYCYAAGFQEATGNAAGLVCGSVFTSLSNCYSVCDMKGAAVYATAQSVGGTFDKNKVLYISGDYTGTSYGTTLSPTATSTDIATALDAGHFTADTGASVPYNLRDLGLPTTYPFAGISGLRHYGDWKQGFSNGSLVYYEKYLGDVFKFYGTGYANNLMNTDIIGDGYAVAVEHDGDHPLVTVAFGGSTYTYDPTSPATATLELTENVEAKDNDDNTQKFDLYRLPAAALNVPPPAKEGEATQALFYQQAVVTITDQGESETTTWYFNPHFAKTVEPDSPQPTNSLFDPRFDPAIKDVYLRTPRHLYNLSRFYDMNYQKCTNWGTFVQECSMDYRAYSTFYPGGYDWSGFVGIASVPSQQPIGYAGFCGTYEGNSLPISNISIVGYTDDVGFFGRNSGHINNVILASNYVPDSESNCFVRRSSGATLNEIVSIGVLVGNNAGYVNNCATAGYHMSGKDNILLAYSNSKLYVGGLAGRNSGHITLSSANCPEISASTNYAEEVAIGGMVGRNDGNGSITMSYAIGNIEEADVKSDHVDVAGFAAINLGQISDSYCAVSITAGGASTGVGTSSGETNTAENVVAHGFAPKTGQINDATCFYLDKGTYSYAGRLHSYNSDATKTAGTAKTFVQLSDQRIYGWATAENSLFHPNTENESVAYPFRARVTNANGNAHYGDWQAAPMLGTLGVFYWENEVGGSNPGYHLTYLGTKEGGTEAGTTLCTAHDDGGTIESYGYGFYVLAEQDESVTMETEGIAMGLVRKSDKTYDANTYNTTAAQKLEEQIPGYHFYPCTTRVGTSGDYLYLNNGNDNQTGTWTLKFASGGATQTYRYAISPFFANAMQRLNASLAIGVKGTDGNVTYLNQIPGSDGNPFEIRSVEQLQYINWNSEKKNCSTLVYVERNNDYTRIVANANNTYKQYPYLQYTTLPGAGTQQKNEVDKVRPIRTWVQSHDLLGSSFGENYTPIAGKATSSAYNAHANGLYAWFGGNYDGQSYKIQNLNIVSDSYTVGLFGVTVGANIKNVILYGDGTTRVERNTNKNTGVGDKTGAYQIGGLVGLAYDYAAKDENRKVENCAIAGYNIIDNSRNQHGQGYANVGGLFGITQIKMERCSAVVNIDINYQSPSLYRANGTVKPVTEVYSYYGNMLRVGGIAGTALDEIRDSYTGGGIYVSDPTRDELPYETRTKDQYNGVNRWNSLLVFVGGIAGSSYTASVVNLTGNTGGATDGTLTISNCYTYMNLPVMSGNVRSTSIFAGTADRARRGTKLYIKNCYYLAEEVLGGTEENPLDGTVDAFVAAYTHPKFFYSSETGNTNHFTDQDIRNILFGGMDRLGEFLLGHGKGSGVNPTDANQPLQQYGYSYTQLKADDMATKLNGDTSTNWTWVTKKEGDAEIAGKYSFSDKSYQNGKNYPFPTVITQKDLIFQGPDINVHYGAWPQGGNVWSNGRDSMDIFKDMQKDPDTGKYTYAEKTFTLRLASDFDFSTLTEYNPTGWQETAEGSGVFENESCEGLTFSVAPVKAQVIEVHQGKDANGVVSRRHVEVTLRALEVGAANVYAHVGETEADFNLSITANLTLGHSPAAPSNYANDSTALPITLSAVSAEDAYNIFTDVGYWKLLPYNSKDSSYLTIIPDHSTDPPTQAGKNIFKVSSNTSGKYVLEAHFSYVYMGKAETETYKGAPIDVSVTFPLVTKGKIGLSDGTNYSYHMRRSSGDYLSGAQMTETLANLKDFSKPRGPELFLYAPATDGDLGAFYIESVKIGSTTLAADDIDHLIWSGSNYKVTFESAAASAGSGYSVRTASVRYTGSGDPPSPTVTVTVKLREPGPGEANTRTSYELSVAGVAVHKYILSFDGNGATSGEMFSVGHNGTVDKLEPNAFRKTGYTFSGWKTQPDSGTYYTDEDTRYAATADETLYAQWTPITYKLKLVPNTKDNTSMRGATARDLTDNKDLTVDEDGVLTVTYDHQIRLPSVEDKLNPPDNAVFGGWCTDPKGYGDYYDDAAEIKKNLASEQDEEVSLYAMWPDEHTLKLMVPTYGEDGKPSGYTPICISTATALKNQTVIPMSALTEEQRALVAGLSKAGWTFDGWYTSTDGDGARVLKQPGDMTTNLAVIADESVNRYPYTNGGLFKLEKDGTLYARWSRTAYGRVDTTLNPSVWSTEGNNFLIVAKDTTDYVALTNGKNPDGSNFHETFVRVCATDCESFDEENKASGSYIVGSNILTSSTWKLNTIAQNVYNAQSRETGYPYYLWRLDNGTIYLKTTGATKTSDLGALLYAVKNGVHSISMKNSGNMNITWDASKQIWKAEKNKSGTALYRLQTIYSYAPISSTETYYYVETDRGAHGAEVATTIPRHGITSYKKSESAEVFTLDVLTSDKDYSFNGWKVNNSKPQKILQLTVSKSYLAVADWTINKYTVDFNSNGGTGTVASQTHERRETWTLPDCTFRGPADTPYFTGWNTAADGSGTPPYANLAEMCFQGDADAPETLYAQWSATCDLTLQTYSGSQPLTLDAQRDFDYSTVTEPSRDGWVFTGWCTEDGQMVLKPNGTVVAGNVPNYVENGVLIIDRARTLYACWEWMPERFASGQYQPNGEKWLDVTPAFNLNSGYFEAKIDLSTCDKSKKANILGFGNGDISAWSNGKDVIQLYYPTSSNNTKLQISEMIKGGKQEYTLSSTDLTVRLEKNAFYINGVAYNWNNDNYKAVLTHLAAVDELVLNVGSQEGSNRSNATYDYIKVVSWDYSAP